MQKTIKINSYSPVFREKGGKGIQKNEGFKYKRFNEL
jgi:hypothetical protein